MPGYKLLEDGPFMNETLTTAVWKLRRALSDGKFDHGYALVLAQECPVEERESALADGSGQEGYASPAEAESDQEGYVLQSPDAFLDLNHVPAPPPFPPGEDDERWIPAGFGRQNTIHHSSFLAGAPVAAAGEIKVVNGRLVSVSNGSGHYRPPPGYLINFLKALRRMDPFFDLSTVMVEIFAANGARGNPTPAHRYTAHEFYRKASLESALMREQPGSAFYMAGQTETRPLGMDTIPPMPAGYDRNGNEQTSKQVGEGGLKENAHAGERVRSQTYGTHVRYFNLDERRKYAVSFSNGLLQRQVPGLEALEPLNTVRAGLFIPNGGAMAQPHWINVHNPDRPGSPYIMNSHLVTNRFLFVLSRTGTIYAADQADATIGVNSNNNFGSKLRVLRNSFSFAFDVADYSEATALQKAAQQVESLRENAGGMLALSTKLKSFRADGKGPYSAIRAGGTTDAATATKQRGKSEAFREKAKGLSGALARSKEKVAAAYLADAFRKAQEHLERGDAVSARRFIAEAHRYIEAL
jgi:hypothetical protein